MSKVDLLIGWASYDYAKFACENYHYSKCIPAGKLSKIGVWEDGKPIGVIIFGRGANKSLGSPYGYKQWECCELVRIALTSHKNTVSRIMMIAIKFFYKHNRGIKLIVSFADSGVGHIGAIYQATNWIYSGKSIATDEYIFNGRRYHGRSFRAKYGSHNNYIDKGLLIVKGSCKLRYLMPMNEDERKNVIKFSLPYPKHAG